MWVPLMDGQKTTKQTTIGMVAGDSDACGGRAATQVSIYCYGWSVRFWIVGQLTESGKGCNQII